MSGDTTQNQFQSTVFVSLSTRNTRKTGKKAPKLTVIDGFAFSGICGRFYDVQRYGKTVCVSEETTKIFSNSGSIVPVHVLHQPAVPYPVVSEFPCHLTLRHGVRKTVFLYKFVLR